MTEALLGITALFGLVGVVVGAFGAHALRDRVPPERAGLLETSSRYLFFALPGLVATAVLAASPGAELFEAIAALGLVIGTLVFSGGLAGSAVSGVDRWGRATPIGGTLLLIGWACLLVAVMFEVTTGGGVDDGFLYRL